MEVVHVTETTFEEEVLKSQKPVLVDFWATWCGPCQMMGPVIEQMAKEHSDIKFCKVDVDKEPGLAQQYRVMSIPTLVAFRDGQVIRTSIGVQSKEEILEMFQQIGKEEKTMWDLIIVGAGPAGLSVLSVPGCMTGSA